MSDDKKKQSRYAIKRRSGNMMYGPMPNLGPKFPDWKRPAGAFCKCDHLRHQEAGITYAECEREAAQRRAFLSASDPLA